MADYLANADVWVALDLITMEFKTDPMSMQYFDGRLVERAIQLSEQRRLEEAKAAMRGVHLPPESKP